MLQLFFVKVFNTYLWTQMIEDQSFCYGVDNLARDSASASLNLLP